MVILSSVAQSSASSAYNINYTNVTQNIMNGQTCAGSKPYSGDSLLAYNNTGLQRGSFGGVNPFSGTNSSGGSGNRGLSSTLIQELEAIAQEIGDDALIGIERDASGTPVGIRLNYSPKRVGEILMNMAKNRNNSTSIVGQMRRLLGLLEAGRYIGLRVFSVDESGQSADTGILNSSSTVIGSTNQLISPSTQGFNAFSRAAEVLLAWLDVLALDPTTIQGDSVDVAGTQIAKADIESVNEVLKQNPEIPAALQQFARSLDTLNKRQEANIASATNLREINKSLTQPTAKAGGGGGQG